MFRRATPGTAKGGPPRGGIDDAARRAEPWSRQAGRTEAGRSHGSRRNGGRTTIPRPARMGWSVGRFCARVWQSSATLTPLRQPGTWLGGNAMRRSGRLTAPARKRTTGTPRPSTERPSWQVSWLAGHRFCLAFPMPAGTSDTYSTDARRSQLRGQLRHGLQVQAPSDAPDSLLALAPIAGDARTTTARSVGARNLCCQARRIASPLVTSRQRGEMRLTPRQSTVNKIWWRCSAFVTIYGPCHRARPDGAARRGHGTDVAAQPPGREGHRCNPICPSLQNTPSPACRPIRAAW